MANRYPFITFLRKKKHPVWFFLPAILLFMGCNNQDRTWSVYKADATSSSYSVLKEINKENVYQLKLAWTFNPGDAVEGSRFAGSQCNPIILDGVMYAASARHRIYAIDAGNGKQIWSFDPYNGGPGGGSFRGVTYWEDGNDKRILFTGGDDLFALNAETGTPIREFGKNGKVSMNVGIRDDPEKISVKPTSPGIVYNDLLIIGNEVSELYGAQPGYIRAYNIRTGKLEWTFHTIPKPGEPGYDTWPKDAWKYAGGANDWGGMSVDEKRGMVFLATGSPSYDFYGYDRLGKNLFGNCVVALDAKTGKYIWHFQTIHHDLWDYDLPAPPNLVTVEKDGKKIDAVAQTSKVGFLYVLNRETGASLFPIEERPVPASDVPGEEAWPTQPIPLKPKPYSRQYMTTDDLSDFSVTAHDSLIKLFNSLRYEGLFTPPSIKGTLNLPGTIGGSEWGGAAYDPATGILYLKANESPEIDLLQKIDPATDASANPSIHEDGKKIYTSYCATCHKADRKGDEPLYPSLLDLKKRMTEAEALNKIKGGSGKMPPFAGILKGHEDGIIDYLFEKTDERMLQKESGITEIRNNRLSNIEVKKENVDTAITYLNVTAYAQLKDPEGHPAIKPPWGTLNAINLNTGDYAWTIPVGNNADLQKKGEPITGSTGSPGPIVTRGGLVFLGGSRDRKFQAFDKATGSLLWETTLPGFASSTPCTYQSNGKQYIAVSVAGSKESPAGTIMAFALPD
ncbi:MAG: pyrroloquinoline quinone-dependent dehydrogenase [Chitinophagaceae bacterium]|nr:pyrroloquinoline quinone-dependent dehydrogenase [Chitinophagaceae bacterium]